MEANCPEYTQDTVSQMAKVFTGWTYGTAPGYASQWTNQPYYFGPMTPFDSHHDMTAKTISLPDAVGSPNACVIPAGGSAVSDLNLALDCLAGQSNVAPFISYRLIQRLVKSNPTPAYVLRVSTVFKSSAAICDPWSTRSSRIAKRMLRPASSRNRSSIRRCCYAL